MTTFVAVAVSWYPCEPTEAGAPDSSSATVPPAPDDTGRANPVEARRMPASWSPMAATSR